MAVLKFTNSKGSLKKILDYVMQPKKTETALISGQHCMPETAFEEMTATRNIYNKPGGRQYIHLVQSFAPFDKLTHSKGYTVKQGKQLAFKPPGGERFIRLRSLGKRYTEPAIREKLEGSITATLQRAQAAKCGPAHKDFVYPNSAPQEYGGLQAAYWKLLYLLDKVRDGAAPNHIAIALKAELVNTDHYTRQMQLLVRYGLQDGKGLESLMESNPDIPRADMKTIEEIQRHSPQVTQKLMEVDALHRQHLEKQNQARIAPKRNRGLESLR